jgi:hypothetical protein
MVAPAENDSKTSDCQKYFRQVVHFHQYNLDKVNRYQSDLRLMMIGPDALKLSFIEYTTKIVIELLSSSS